MSADQLDLFGAPAAAPVDTGAAETSAPGPDRQDDVLFSYYQASNLLWVVEATHEASGRVASTTVGDTPVDPYTLDKLARSARRPL